MSINLAEFQTLRKKCEDLKSQADRAAGALEQRMKELANEFGCNSVEEGQKLLAQMSKDLEEKENTYKTKLAEFKEKWEKELEKI